MTDVILDLLQRLMASPWVYLLLFAVAVVDAFLPAVPSETAVITAGVFAASGRPALALVVVVAALGAFTGDHVSYLIGRAGGRRLIARLRPGGRGRAAFAWAERALAERGGLLLVVARYVPGGRTAATLTAGAGGFPLRRFSLFDGIAAVSWALYSGVIGFVGGAAFEHDPIKGLLLGLGIALTATTATETVRHLRRKLVLRQVPAVPEGASLGLRHGDRGGASGGGH
jgi:membrane protein DedA with SNARE-associated domain